MHNDHAYQKPGELADASGIDHPRPVRSVGPSRPIHVLTLTPFYPSQNDDVDGTFVAEPLETLASFDVVATVVAAKPSAWGVFKNSRRVQEPLWIRYPQIPGRAAYGSWGLLLYTRLRRVIERLHRDRHIDLIHAHAALPCGHAAALISRQLQIPFVVTLHGLDVFSTRREKGLLGRWVNQCSRFVYQRASASICVSEAVRHVLVDEMGDAIKTAVIYNGVDTSLFRPPLDEVEASAPTILSVGRLVPDKGHELVLRAVAALTESWPQLQYEIIDDGPERTRLRTLSQELQIGERVHFLGRQDRQAVAAAMKRCTLFALPSNDEAMGCVYLEAMATAKPIIGCRRQGIEEIVRHGENGWLIQPGSLEEMARALVTLLENAELQKRMGFEARKTIVKDLTIKHQAARLNCLYRECLGFADEC